MVNGRSAALRISDPILRTVKEAAQAISVLLHPILMPVLALWAAMNLDPHLSYFLPPHARLFTLGMVAVMSVLFPLISMLLLRRAGVISSLELPLREERIAPFVLVLIYYGMTYYMLRQTRLDGAVLALFIGAMLALFLTTLITLRWKISVHLVGIGGLVGTVAGISGMYGNGLLSWLALSIILTGVLGTARLLTGSHVPAQVYAGGVLGFACTYGCLAFGVSV